MIKIVRKEKNGVRVKYPNGKILSHSWEDFNKYFTIGENNEAVVKEDNENVLKANSVLEEAIQLAITKLNTNNSALMGEINQKIDEIMKITNAPEEKRKTVKYLIWSEANEKATLKTTLGDLLSVDQKAKLNNKGN